MRAMSSHWLGESADHRLHGAEVRGLLQDWLPGTALRAQRHEGVAYSAAPTRTAGLALEFELAAPLWCCRP